MKPHSDQDYLYRERLRKKAQQIDNDVDAVIVEGESDKRVLEQLGMDSIIYTCGGKNPELFSEGVTRVAEHVVILTDFDSHGKELNKRLKETLIQEVDVMAAHRRDFGKILTSRDRYCVEDIRPLFHSTYDKFIDAGLDRLFTPFS